MENNEFDQTIIDADTKPVGNDKLFAILSYFGILFLIGLFVVAIALIVLKKPLGSLIVSVVIMVLLIGLFG